MLSFLYSRSPYVAFLVIWKSLFWLTDLLWQKSDFSCTAPPSVAFWKTSHATFWKASRLVFTAILGYIPSLQRVHNNNAKKKTGVAVCFYTTYVQEYDGAVIHWWHIPCRRFGDGLLSCGSHDAEGSEGGCVQDEDSVAKGDRRPDTLGSSGGDCMTQRREGPVQGKIVAVSPLACHGHENKRNRDS